MGLTIKDLYLKMVELTTNWPYGEGNDETLGMGLREIKRQIDDLYTTADFGWADYDCVCAFDSPGMNVDVYAFTYHDASESILEQVVVTSC